MTLPSLNTSLLHNSYLTQSDETDLARETPQEKIERQRRDRYIQSEKDWSYVQANEPRYNVHREKILAERKAVNTSKGDNTTNFLPSIGVKSKSITSINKSKVDPQTRFLSRVEKKPKDAIVKNFRCGDLMYGTSFGRDENYLKKLEDYHRVNVVNSVIGENNGNEWARKGTRNNRSMIINSYSDPVRSALSDEFDRLKKMGGNFRMPRLSEAISKAMIGRPAKYGFDFDAYHNVASTHEKLKISSKHVVEWEWWKRGSKSGIEMVAQQSPDSERKIHFILDGMNIRGVTTKDTRLYGGTITASELRYIYRHWDRLKGKAIFYRDGKVVSPPWEDIAYSDLWEAYHPKRRQRE